jgi:hypothetical protein
MKILFPLTQRVQISLKDRKSFFITNQVWRSFARPGGRDLKLSEALWKNKEKEMNVGGVFVVRDNTSHAIC